MHKILKFIKSNNFIKAIVALVIGMIWIGVSGSSTSHSSKLLSYAGVVGRLFFLVAFIFLILSAIKDSLWFKVVSILIIICGSLGFGIMVFISAASKQYTDVTDKYNDCIKKSNNAMESLDLKSAQNLSLDEWKQLQKDYIRSNVDLTDCLKSFEGKQMFAK